MILKPPQSISNRPITMSPKKILDKSPMVNKSIIGTGDTETKIQKTLLVVDNIRLQTINTLEALQDLSREDSVKLADLNRSMKELVAVSNGILDASTAAPEGEAQNFLKALNETKKLLHDYQKTEIKGMTLEQFLEKQEVEHDRQVLRDKEIAQIITDASHSLGKPFADFLEDNINRISTTPVSQGAFDTTVAAFGGPLAPLFSLIGKSLPEAIAEFRSIKSSFSNLKEQVFGKKDEVKKLGNEINVDKAIQQENARPTSLVGIPSSEEVQEENESDVQDNESKKFHTKVVSSLDKIERTLNDELDDIKDNTKAAADNAGIGGGGLLSGLGGKLGNIAKSLGKFLPMLGKGGLYGGLAYGAYKAGEAGYEKLKEKLADPESDVHKFAKEHAPWTIPGNEEDSSDVGELKLAEKDSLIKTFSKSNVQMSSNELEDRAYKKFYPDKGNDPDAYAEKILIPSKELKPGGAIQEQGLKLNKNTDLKVGDKAVNKDDVKEVPKIEPLREKPVIDEEKLSSAIADKLSPLVKTNDSKRGGGYPSPSLVDMVPNVSQDPISQLINSGTL